MKRESKPRAARRLTPGKVLQVRTGSKGFEVKSRLDTEREVEYYLHGDMLRYVLRRMASRSEDASA